MARNNFESCLQEILRHEGGFSDVRSDPGNWTGGRVGAGLLKGTKYGISAAAYPTIDIKNITVEFAASQYKNKYWNRVKGDQLPDGIDLVAFDPAVNSGVSRGSRWLQSALGVTQDGKIGPQTVLAAQTATDGVAVIKRACAARMGFLRGLTSLWSTYSRGWTRRVASVEATAVAMYTRSSVAVRQERKKAYDRFQEILVEQQPYTFLYVAESLPAVHRRFHGIEPAPAGISYNFERWYVPTALQKHSLSPGG